MKYYRTWAEINLDNLRNNFLSIKNKVNSEKNNCLISAVIKADAYGHGAIAVAKELEPFTDLFSVAMIDEALQLRKNGIKKPLQILGYTHESRMEEAIKNDIYLTTFSLENAEKISRSAQKLSKTAEVFIAVDSGMSRIGFEINDKSGDEIISLSKLKNIKIKCVYSHFAKADYADKSSASIQKKLFSDFCDKLETIGNLEFLRSLNNSAAIIDMPSENELVRTGILLYGLYPSKEVIRGNLAVKPVMSLKTRIVHIHTIEKDVGVSYGHTFTSKEKTVVATLSAGYADGVPRLLSNRGKVLIRGQLAPIIGTVCMDFTMVDITKIKDASVDDIAVIIGEDGANLLTAEDVADWSDTINYEITCLITNRVPKIYIINEKIVEVTEHF